MNIKNYIKRDILRDLQEHLNKKEMTFIVGPRQVGKTTLMNILKSGLEKNGKKTLFLSLDFEADKKFFISQNALIDRLRLEFGRKSGYVFLDEIQRKDDAGIFLKGIYDMNLPYKFIISGSGSVDLKERVYESLAGRKILFEVSPVSPTEFVNFKTDYKYENKLEDYFSVEKDRVDILLGEYLNFGGYPRVILEDSLREKTKIIDEIYHSYFEKDISYLLKVEKLDVFSSLVKLLAGQIGQLLNYSEIAGALNVSLPTVKNYLYYLEKTFVIQKITPFFKNTRKEIIKSPLIYFHDLGLRNYSFGVFGQINRSDDFGFLFQNLIFNFLKNNLKFSNTKINFWRTKEKAKVDFILNSGKKIVAIEVKYKNFKNPQVGRSLRNFINKYQPDTALVINRNLKGKIKTGKTEINFIMFGDLVQFKFDKQ